MATNKPNVVFSYCRLLLDDKKGWHASTWVPTDSTVLSEGAHHKGYIFYDSIVALTQGSQGLDLPGGG